ncbi:MAG: hypothetical protein AUF76_19495 [Acidobacteria bacterium 13_1_20CM_2_65_9]|nr:MAG: hypothetical protein AUF76_19495 [Acidobacteria bacterium 13_1_20CM_2_65_9]
MAIEFVATGSPREVARAIEEYAHGQGHVSAIVVPWESSATMLSMAVTSVKSDGWAIEHTNLGTITLSDLGDASTAVAVTAHDPDHAEKPKLTGLFDRFAEQLQRRFKA